MLIKVQLQFYSYWLQKIITVLFLLSKLDIYSFILIIYIK